MSQIDSAHKTVIDWLTVVAIAAIAISFNVAFHEGVHALTCLAVGGDLLEYSALYESCNSPTIMHVKIVAGSAPTFNLIAGVLMLGLLRRSQKRSSETQLFLWFFMLMNWFYGAGYFIFSGISNVGDWAVVIEGWEPGWFFRILMAIVGIVSFMVFIRVGLTEFGKMVGGDAEDQIQRGNRFGILAYFTSFVVVLMAGFFCPYGLLSLPVTAGVFAVLGALSPFLWMMRWFRTEHFLKLEKEPLEIHRKWEWLTGAVIVVFAYVFILGRTLYF